MYWPDLTDLRCEPGMVIPILYQGPSEDNIDMVFFMDEDYGNDRARFLSDAKSVALDPTNGFATIDPISSYASHFNYWYYVETADYQPTCQKFSLPGFAYERASFTDVAVILFQGGGRACSLGGGMGTSAPISTNPTTRTLAHETGHKLFDLADEYPGDGGYWTPSWGQANIYHTKSDCEANSIAHTGPTAYPCFEFCPTEYCGYTGNAFGLYQCQATATANRLDPEKCVQKLDSTGNWVTCSPNWCDWRDDGWQECCGDGWWKADTSSCRMEDSGGLQFDPDCKARMLSIFSNKFPITQLISPSQVNPAAHSLRSGIASFSSPDATTVLILTYHLKGNEVTLKDAKIIHQTAPNSFKQEGPYVLEMNSGNAGVLNEIYFDDPRELHLADQKDNEPGILMRDDFDFTMIMPGIPTMKTVIMKNTDTGEILNSFDIGDAITEFCNVPLVQDPICRSANNPPDLTNPGDKSVSEGKTLEITLVASDKEGGPLTYSFTSTKTLPGAVISGNTFTWTPPSGSAGSYQVTFKVTDTGGLTDEETTTITVILPVKIDIKPGSCPNAFNRNENGVLPVAIVGTTELDVKTIDPTSITINGVKASKWEYKDTATPYLGTTSCGCHARSGDGKMDLILYFTVKTVASTLPGTTKINNMVSLNLAGKLKTGSPIEGKDCIKIVK
jgi:hypothetical protein